MSGLDGLGWPNPEDEPKTSRPEAPPEQEAGEGCSGATCSASWIPATTKPTGWERKVLVWVVWPQCGWPQWPEPLIGWWKHGPGCFAVDNVENANHLVTHWMDISEPNAGGMARELAAQDSESPTKQNG